MYNDSERKMMLHALAIDEEQAKKLILDVIKNEEYKQEVIMFFATTTRPPSIYSEPTAHIWHQGIPILL